MVRVIIFSSVRFLSKKSNQTGFKKKNRNRFKPTGFGSVFLKQKPVWLGFFPVWLGFFQFGFDSVFSVLGLFYRN
jgi:hypothetical protein